MLLLKYSCFPQSQELVIHETSSADSFPGRFGVDVQKHRNVMQRRAGALTPVNLTGALSLSENLHVPRAMTLPSVLAPLSTW